MLVIGLQMGHDAAATVINDGVPLNNLERERSSRIKHAGLVNCEFIDMTLRDAGVFDRDIDFFAITTSQNWPFIFINKKDFYFEFDASQAQILRLPYEIAASMGKVNANIGLKKDFYKNLVIEKLHRARSEADIHSTLSWLSNDIFDPINDKFWDLRQNVEFYLQMNRWKDISNSISVIEELSSIRRNIREKNTRVCHVPISVYYKGKKYPGAIIPHHLAHASCAFYSSNFEKSDIFTVDNAVESNFYGLTGGLFCIGEGNLIHPLGPHFMPHSRYYSISGNYLGWGSFDGPGKLMGLAPYGKPILFDADMIGNIFDCEKIYTGPSQRDSNHFLSLFNSKMSSSKSKKEGWPLDNHKCDFAASIQKLFEKQSLFALRNFEEINTRSKIFESNLCLSGGGALNCPTNSLIWRETGYQNVFVPPTSDDGGLALGAAWYLLHTVLNRPRCSQTPHCSSAAFLGQRVSDQEVREAIAHRINDLDVTEPSDVADKAAQDLSNNSVIGWFTGRCEVGPRALGNRSILSNPIKGENWKRVNSIKSREEWRPFAPAVLEEEAHHWFSGAPLPSPYMLFTANVKRPKDIPAVTHVDGSARIQTVSKNLGPFRHVLEGFHKYTSTPILLNTSFNGPGEPIVDRPREALDLFLKTDLDVLYLSGIRITKKKNYSVTSEE